MPRTEAGEWLGADEVRERLSAIIESSDDAIFSKDSRAIITSWNPAAERMYGYSASEAIGSSVSILIPEHRAGEEQRILERILNSERVDHYETERITRDGRMIRVSLTVSPIRDAEGEIVGASVIARDVTGRHRTLTLAARLQEVTASLSREITPERVVDVVLNQVIGALAAQAGAVGLVHGEDVVVAGNVGYSSEDGAKWERFAVDADVPMASVVRTGEAVWATTPNRVRDPFAEDITVRYSALAILPLAIGGERFGALALSFEEPREFDPEERAFLVAATQQAAYALNRARMYEQERLRGERQRFLAEAGELLTQSLDPDVALRNIAQLAVRYIAEGCAVELLEEDGPLRNIAVAHRDARRERVMAELRKRYPVDADADRGVARVIRTGKTVFDPEIDDDMLVEAARDEEHLRLLRKLGPGSVVIVPLRARGRTLGAMTFIASPRALGEEDVSFAVDLGRRAGLAVDNAMLFRREHETALMLQRSLLPQSVPRSHGTLAFDVRYRPAGPGLEIGGDWYDLVVVDDGTVALTIGDVAGRGVRAASVMGRMRPALRAYVVDGHRPKKAIERFDRLVRESQPPEMITVFHLHYDPDTGRASYVRAGHPPAVMRHAGGQVVELAGAGTPPLGIYEDCEVVEHETQIPPGSLLVLYTDGLIEQRDVDVVESLNRLKEALSEAPASPGECLDWLESRLSTDGIPDDVAMVAMAVPA